MTVGRTRTWPVFRIFQAAVQYASGVVGTVANGNPFRPRGSSLLRIGSPARDLRRGCHPAPRARLRAFPASSVTLASNPAGWCFALPAASRLTRLGRL